MIYLLLSLVVLGVVAALISLFSAKHGGADEEVVNTAATCATCDGTDTRCEQTCMMEAATRLIEYYDDEELDRYKGRPSDSYADDEIKDFEDVLYTMRPDEVKGWSRSLTLRGVHLPDALKDEVLMLMEQA